MAAFPACSRRRLLATAAGLVAGTASAGGLAPDIRRTTPVLPPSGEPWEFASLDTHDDVGAAVNSALEAVGDSGIVIVPPGEHRQTTQIEPVEAFAEQELWAYGATIRAADGVEFDQVSGAAPGFCVRGGHWDGNYANQAGGMARNIHLRSGSEDYDGYRVLDVTVNNSRQHVRIADGADHHVENVVGIYGDDAPREKSNVVTVTRTTGTTVSKAVGEYTDTMVFVDRCDELVATDVVGRSVDGSFGFDVRGSKRCHLSGTVIGDPNGYDKGAMIHSYPSGGDVHERRSEDNTIEIDVSHVELWGVDVKAESNGNTIDVTVDGRDEHGTPVTRDGVYVHQGAFDNEIHCDVHHVSRHCINEADGHGNTYRGTVNAAGAELVRVRGTDSIVDVTIGPDDENGVLDDRGVRTIFNGVGTNDGDPALTGAWRGYATRAHRHDVVVENIDTSPATRYRAEEDGTWYRIR